jgi:DNA repair protein RadC
MVRESDTPYTALTVHAPEDVYPIVRSMIPEDDGRERLVVVLLTASSRVIAVSTVSIGTVDSCLSHPREVYRLAITAGAVSVIVAHNHPGGTAEPSAEDRAVTRRLRDAGTLIGIDLLDHLILGDNTGSYTSLKRLGALDAV